jgi:hypothetical protein
LKSYFLGTRVSRSYCSRITVARYCSRKGIFERKGFILVRVLIRFLFKYSLYPHLKADKILIFHCELSLLLLFLIEFLNLSKVNHNFCGVPPYNLDS